MMSFVVPSLCLVSSGRLFTDRIKTRNYKAEKHWRGEERPHKESTGVESAIVELNISRWSTEHTLPSQTSGQTRHCDRLIIETSLHLLEMGWTSTSPLTITQAMAPRDIYLMTDNINNILLANIHLGLVVLVSWIIVRLPSGPGMFMSKNDPLQLQIISDVKQQSKLHLETNFHQLKLSCQLWLWVCRPS